MIVKLKELKIDILPYPLLIRNVLVETVEMSSNMVISRCPVGLLTVPHPRNLSFLLYDRINLSQRIVVQMTSELVRLKALNVFFTKIIKISSFLNPL